MDVLSCVEINAVYGGSFVNSYDDIGGTTNSGPDPADRLAYEKYIKAYTAWQARHPNLPQEYFDSIYFRY